MKLTDFDFRIWDNTKKCFLKANPFIFISKDKNSTVEVGTEVYYKDLGIEDDNGTTKIFKPKEFDLELELWTGFYDESGKKIYENDILEFFDYEDGYKIIKVEFRKDYGFFYVENRCVTKINDIDNKEFIILGNIHENGDLLK